MADSFSNARPFYDVTFPSSGDGFSISNMKNSLQGLGFMDFVPLQPRAHNPADLKIMVRGRDASSFFNPVYYGDGNQRIPFSSGDSPSIAAPSTNPRIDIVYLTPSGDIKVITGTEAVSPTLPTLAPSGDSRTPICAVWLKTTMTKIVNFEDRNANSGDGYIYQDLRPWLRTAGAGGTKTGNLVPVAPTGDAQAASGSLTSSSREDHTHGGVHGVRVVGSALIQGDVELAGGGITQAGNRITLPPGQLKSVQKFLNNGTWTKPAGVNLIVIEVVGGGGGGGGTNGANTGGAGGGGAGYAKRLITAPNPTETVTIGAGGAGGGDTAAGSPGAASSFGGWATANGGGGGGAGAGSAGAGGTATLGDIVITGSTGGAGNAVTGVPSGAGGSPAGGLGMGGLGARVATGNNGFGFGGGGSGGQSTSSASGGSGVDGIIIVWEYS